MKKTFKFSTIYIIIVLVLMVSVSVIHFYNGYIQEDYYIWNNQKYKGDNPNLNEDVHKVTFKDGETEYINYPKGYRITFPGKVKLDVSRAKVQVSGRIPKKDINFTITREATPYDDAVQYVADYENRFMMDPKFIEENNLTIYRDDIRQVGDYKTESIIFTRNTPENGKYDYNTYAHCYLYTPSQIFFRISFNTKYYSEDFVNTVDTICASFKEDVKLSGTSGFYDVFEPEVPKYWSEETKTAYNNIVNSDSLLWGLYRPQAVRDQRLYKIEDVEAKLGNKFSVAMEYIYFGEDVPVEGLLDAYNQNKLVEFTIQIATVMNQDLNGYNPFFEVLDGQKDAEIKKMAAQFKEFGHPVMLRLNNEMNSDWVSYGGPCTLNEPELYKTVWRYIYDMFRKEGVNNTIWIFNPNDVNCPPSEYNHFVNYYPGNEYVQIFGVTGYNTGTYYADIFGEKWREFETIYDGIMDHCSEYFSNFPWIITEFSSSSVGGDKPQWIRNMFDVIDKYKNIKLAVWFCSVDYDFRYRISDNVIARPYLLDENDECVAAFKEGWQKAGYQPKNLFE